MAKTLTQMRSPEGYISIDLNKPSKALGKKMVLAGGKPSSGAATLVKLNWQELCRKSFAILVEGLAGGKLNSDSTRLEIYSHLTLEGMLCAEDFASITGKQLSHIYKRIDGTPMISGKPLKNTAAFPSMVGAFVADEKFARVWKAALSFAAQSGKEAAKMTREELENQFSNFPNP